MSAGVSLPKMVFGHGFLTKVFVVEPVFYSLEDMLIVKTDKAMARSYVFLPFWSFNSHATFVTFVVVVVDDDNDDYWHQGPTSSKVELVLTLKV